jgi:hypothetical protein
MFNKLRKNKSDKSSKTPINTSLPSAESASKNTFAVRRKASDDLERYRFGKMTVKEAIQYRINLGEFDCKVEVSGKDYDDLKHLCWKHGYKINLSMMMGVGDDAQITAIISW